MLASPKKKALVMWTCTGIVHACNHYQSWSGLFVAMRAGEDVCLATKEQANCCREDGDVGDGVVVASEVDGGAREVFLMVVAADGDVLVEDVGLIGERGSIRVIARLIGRPELRKMSSPGNFYAA